MPKKRRAFTQYSKPQSTTPASLETSSASSRPSNRDDHPARSVNERLADLRRVSLRSQQLPEGPSSFVVPGAPTVPPTIRRILRLPETPGPPPRRPIRLGPNGQRLPPGPAPPRSWLSQSRHAPKSESEGHVCEEFQRNDLPGSYLPTRGSLIDIALRKLAVDWEFQRSYNRYYLYSLPDHLKAALIAYLGSWFRKGVSVADLRAILLPFHDDESGQLSEPDLGTVYGDISHLDLTNSCGRSLKLRELSDLLFPATAAKSPPPSQIELQESWDLPCSETAPSAVPQPLLPNLTHLSLAINPKDSPTVSWRHLLSFCASHFPTLTHLSLAYWPEPSLTPNAKLASFVVAGSGTSRTVQYGGTGPYSHSLDDDWSEAILVLRRLSKSLYGLEWLDLTGCASWATALMATAEHDFVDWVGDWGKMSTVLLYPGYKLGADASPTELERYRTDIGLAARLERYIRAQRAGRGRAIEVETYILER